MNHKKKLYGVLDGLHPEKFPFDKIRVQSLSFKGKIPTEKEKENVTIVRHIKEVVTHNGKVILMTKAKSSGKTQAKLCLLSRDPHSQTQLKLRGLETFQYNHTDSDHNLAKNASNTTTTPETAKQNQIHAATAVRPATASATVQKPTTNPKHTAFIAKHKGIDQYQKNAQNSKKSSTYHHV